MHLTTLFFPPVLANSDGGLIYAFEQSTAPGKAVLIALMLASVFSWSVMVSKFRLLNSVRKHRGEFIDVFRSNRDPLHLYAGGLAFPSAAAYAVYEAACRELAFQLLGDAEVDGTFKYRVENSEPISPSQMRVVNAAMDRAVGETSLRLESQMIVLATAVSGAPFIGLLGTVWGVMETFADVAKAGSASLSAMAPGVSAALITTVTGLLVAIPAMFGYNYLVTSLRGTLVDLDNFSGELASAIEHLYVDHGEGRRRGGPGH